MDAPLQREIVEDVLAGLARIAIGIVLCAAGVGV